jgi:hypothetical protein
LNSFEIAPIDNFCEFKITSWFLGYKSTGLKWTSHKNSSNMEEMAFDVALKLVSWAFINLL